jgi:DNA-directed RNA polymerase subunit RPC12/RpoP
MATANKLETQLKKAVMAVQSGRLAEARAILATMLRQDPKDVKAWVWLGKAVDDPAKRRECFSRALHLDPNNEEARLGMIALLSGPEMVVEGTAERPTQVTAYPLPCPNCGAHLRFDVAARALRCQHCGTERPLPGKPHPPTWLGLPPDLSIPEAQQEPAGKEALRCRSCGAVTDLSIRTASLSCPFCGSPQVVREKAGSFLIPPRAIIPFELDQPAAEQALRDWLGQGWHRPTDLPQKAELLDLHGVYLPFWAFKGLGVVSYRVENFGYSCLPPVESPRQHVPVHDVLLPASFSLGREVLRQVEPYNLEAALAFRPEYLAGWPAEVYQLALADAAMEAQIRMSQESRTKAEVLAPVMADTDHLDAEYAGWGRYGGSRVTHQRPDFCTVQLDSFLHLMLPVWLGAYRYRGQTYSFAVNGQTGKVGGEVPRSAATTTLTVACGAASLALLGMVLWYFWPAISGLLVQQTPGRETTSNLVGFILLAAFVVFLLFELVAVLPRIRNRLRGK